MEIHGNLWTLLWKPMAIVASGTRGNPWTPYKWVSMGFHIFWKLMETNASETHILWKPMETYGHLWKPLEIFRTRSYIWKTMETSGNPW
jgi:hypothetical protein